MSKMADLHIVMQDKQFSIIRDALRDVRVAIDELGKLNIITHEDAGYLAADCAELAMQFEELQ